MRLGRFFTLRSLLLLLLAGGVAAQDAAQVIKVIEDRQVPNRQGLDPYTLREIMDRFHVPGLSVAVVKDLKLHWAKAWGVADVEVGVPVNTETMFQAAS